MLFYLYNFGGIKKNAYLCTLKKKHGFTDPDFRVIHIIIYYVEEICRAQRLEPDTGEQ